MSMRTGFRRWLPVVAGLLGCTGCAERWYYWTLPDAGAEFPPMSQRRRVRQQLVERAGTPSEFLAVRAGGGGTLLVASRIIDDPKVGDDEKVRTFVIQLDGPATKGRHEVGPDNGRLLEFTVWWPTRTPYVGLEGYVDILDVRPDRVTAYCAVRSIIEKAQYPTRVLRGFYTFRAAGGAEPQLRQAGLSFAGAPPGLEDPPAIPAEPATEPSP